MKYMTKEEQEEFWQRHRASKKQIGEDFAKLPRKKQLEIMEKMKANHEAMRSAKPIKR